MWSRADDTDPFSVEEITEVWANVPSDNSYAAFCCWPEEGAPLACVPKTQGVNCTVVYVPPFGNLPATRVPVGKLWEDDDETFGVTNSLREQAAFIYAGNPDKYDLFWQTGENTRVDY